jgi:hypothetical protein
VQVAVSDLEQEFPGALVATNIDATTPESKRSVQELGFSNHGLVIRSGDGVVLWKRPDHEVDVAEVRGALDQLLARQ